MIRTLEQGSKNVALLSKLDRDDRRQLERAYGAVSWLRNVSSRFALLALSCEILYIRSREVKENRQKASSYSCNRVSFKSIWGAIRESVLQDPSR